MVSKILELRQETENQLELFLNNSDQKAVGESINLS